jgi:hypothetical protein
LPAPEIQTSVRDKRPAAEIPDQLQTTLKIPDWSVVTDITYQPQRYRPESEIKQTNQNRLIDTRSTLNIPEEPQIYPTSPEIL